ncbi:IPT/TIG domain-containing protein [Psychrobacillus psychrotolerans]|uniref:IPT/TIG domain-containing protein n=1 Tax=Psychrobacillus psychrotolerans TaxID=126156 RepID=UPI003C73074B
MKILKIIKLALIAILIIGIATPLSTEAATVKSGDLMNINKTVSKSPLVKGETTDVTLTVKGTPQDSTFVKPNDVILIIDKSGSMQTDNRLNAAKQAAKEFIDLMDLTKHEVGIVDFDTNAYSFPLTTDKNAAKAYVDTIQLGGNTNTSGAIRLAKSMLANQRPEAQPTIVIMTDGAANSAPDALAAAKEAKEAGITFYSIALLGPNENPTTSAPNKLLMDMASSAKHHHFVLGSVGLSDVYRKIVEEIGLASAYNVTITDTISPEFELVPGSYDTHIPRPTVNGNTISWFISELKTDELSFTYQVRAKDSATAGKYTLAQTSSTFEIGDGSTYSLNTTNPIIEIKNHAPIITSIKENKGLTTGGETVTITGQNFLPLVKVFFGANLATVVSVTDNEIVVTTPTGPQGLAKVKIQNTDGQFALGDFSYYAVPTITKISPTEGPLTGGNFVTINGTNYMNGAIVSFNDVASVNTTFISANQLRVAVPAAAKSGVVTVKVVNPDTTSAELKDAYTYLAPPPPPAIKISSLSVTSGELIGGTPVLVKGENFDSNVKVYFGDTPATTNFISSTSARIVIPAALNPGFVSVKAENPDGTNDVLIDAYEYLAPPPPPAIKINNLSVTSGLLQGGTSILVNGENFATNMKVYFGDTLATQVTAVSDTRVRVTVPVALNPGFVSVKVENPDGASDVLVDSYEYLAPPVIKIISLSSTSGELKGGTSITVNGENFVANTKVYFGDILAKTALLSSNSLKVTVPSAVNPGFVSIKVENPDGMTDLLTDAYEYLTPPPLPAPEIISLSENSIVIGQTKNITLNGKNIATTSKVYFDDQLLRSTLISSEQVRLVIPVSSIPGSINVKVVNADGQIAVLANGFTYTQPVPEPAPIITSLSSVTGTIKGNELVTITGDNFKSGAKVYFGNTTSAIVSISSTEIKVKTPASLTPGPISVKVVNLDQQEALLQNGYTYEGLKPTITGLSINNGALSGGYTTTVSGTNFDSKMIVTVGGKTAVFSIISANQIKVKIPAGTSSGPVELMVNLHGEIAIIQFTYN